MSKCYSCNENLRKARKKYRWYLAQGFDPKDASAEILRDPDSKLPPKQCCIIALQTNVDIKDTDEYLEELRGYDEVNASTQSDERALQASRASSTEREFFTLFPFTSNGSIGSFTLLDSPFADLELLTTEDNEKGRVGFDITNITKIQESLRKNKKWSNENAPMIWFGNVKLVSIEQLPVSDGEGKRTEAGLIIWKNNRTNEYGTLSPSDVTFLNSKVVKYGPENCEIQVGQGQGTQIIPVEALVVEKVPSRDNYYL